MHVEQTDIDAETASVVPDHELACRLSYFLWASMPDEELFEAAASGRLRKPAHLKQQALRMLRDKKIKALSEHFGGPWLLLLADKFRTQ